MTERAKRAADELKRRGWSIDGELNKECHRCGYGLAGGIRFCPQCGTECHCHHGSDALADLESAIAAAMALPQKTAATDEIAVSAWKLRMCFYDEHGEMAASREPKADAAWREAAWELEEARCGRLRNVVRRRARPGSCATSANIMSRR